MFASIAGTATIHADARSFVAAFAHRIEAGLLLGRPHPRSHYVVTRSGPDHLEFRAADWKTAISVGLNEVELAFPARRSVTYRVQYPRWARYVVGLCGALGVGFVACLVVLSLRGDITRHGAAPSAGVSLAIAWSMALFWGFAWPWILIALHKRPLRRLVDRLIAEVDAAASQAGPTGHSR